jgi:hypothetical protein
LAGKSSEKSLAGAGLILMPDTFMGTRRNLDLIISLAAR